MHLLSHEGTISPPASGQCCTGRWLAGSISLHYANNYYDSPQGFDWGQAIEGFSQAGAPPATVTKGAATNETVYRACATVGDRPAVRMDAAAGMSTNSLTVKVSSSDFADLTLEFDHRESFDEPDAGDGVFVSANGTAYTRVMTIEGSSTWKHYETNIVALAQANGISTANNLFIRFQQMDNSPWSGNDGREFANIRVYSKPDLAWESLAASPTNYLYKGSVAKTFTFSGQTRLAGGDAAVTGQTFSVLHRLYDDRGTIQSTSVNYTPEIPAFGHRLEDFSSSVVVPAGTLLTQSLYRIEARLDSGGALAEGRESNNSVYPGFLVNHYSGVLRFSNTATTVTLTSWDFQSGYGAPTYSPERHVITGTGTIAGRTFGFTNLKVRKQMGTCDYVIDPSETQTFTLSGYYDTTGTVAGVRFIYRSSVTLGRYGVTADVVTLLPAGCAFVNGPTQPWGTPYAGPSTCQLDSNLRPAGTFDMAPQDNWFTEESKPLFFEASGMSWNATAGTFAVSVTGVAYAHDAAMDELDARAAALDIPLSAAVRRSNDGYYRSVATNSATVTIGRDAHGAAQLNFVVGLATNRFRTHLPYDVEVAWNKVGKLAVTNDLPVVSPLASELDDGANFGVYYGSGCPGGCAGTNNTRLASCLNDADAFYFTKDGGLYAPCSFAGGYADLKWGYIATSGHYAQRAYGFKAGVLHVPGHFLKADDCPAALGDDDTPGALALSAVGGAGDELTRPLGAGYADGDGNYAGVTVLWESSGDCLGQTLLGDKETFGPYPLDESCKFYVRQSGVTGIHVADSGYSPDDFTLYGYPFTLFNLAFSYLSTENLKSRSAGRVEVPSPCDFSLDFEELKLTCLGDIASAKPPDSVPKLDLAYWSATVIPSTIQFASTDDCAVGNRTLVMDVSTKVDNIPDKLYGRLGFRADGNLSCAADAGAGGNSRLDLPDTVTLPGPDGSTYKLRPTSQAYFNDHRQHGDLSAIGDGLLTFAGELDVPFFENLLVQAFTSADTEGGVSPVYLVGGWPTHGWTISGQTPFTDAAFDAANAAHPTNNAAPLFSEYLAGSDTDYIPRARREWIAGIGFDIGVRWDHASRSFRSPAPVENNLYVLSTEYNVPQLTAERAEITFGLQYGELPALNLSSVFFNAVDSATGISATLTDAVGDVVTSALDDGVAALEKMTSTDPTDLLGNTLADQVDPLVDQLYVAISNAYATGSSVTNQIGLYIRGGAPTQSLKNRLAGLVDGLGTIGTGLGVAEDLQAKLDETLTLLDAVVTGVEDPSMGGTIGLLLKEDGDYALLAQLANVMLLFAMPAMGDASAEIESSIHDIMESIKPTLDSVRETLLDVREQLGDLRSSLGTGGEFHDELADALDPAQVTALADTVADRLEAEFAALNGSLSPAQNYTRDELKALIRTTILDALREASPIADLQRIVRSRMVDVDRQVRDGVDSVLGQVNWAMREALSEVVGSLDTSISGMVGEFSDVLGTGQVEGYAHIQGDSLDKLRLDLAMQMKVPEEMQFAGYLEIVNEQTRASGGCAFDEGSTYKVTLGAKDVSCNWLGSDMRINCDCFFTLNDGIPKGMGGGVELVGGSLKFETLEVERFGAAVAFGALENYIAATARVVLNGSVEMEGGIFFGRTCDIRPLLLVDDEADKVLGQPPFTGAYVYGEAWIPIYDYGCVFRIKAGAGFGVFYFAEGPTYGVHILLGASGEALCVVDVRGTVEIYGLKQGDAYRARGKGKIKGKVGCCPFCVKFNKSVTITYDDGEWDADY
jgi:hypothetical protein